MKFDALMNYLSLAPLLPKSWLHRSWLHKSATYNSESQAVHLHESGSHSSGSHGARSQTAMFGLKFSQQEHPSSFSRRYIRHPSGIPIQYQVNEEPEARIRPLKNIGVGGLCFVAEQPLLQGAKIHIHIPLEFRTKSDKGFDADGYVAWCLAEDDHYTIGVEFNDGSSQFCVRMVEQVCHIEEYRANAKQYQGRELSSEEAAKEWIEQFAATFPD